MLNDPTGDRIVPVLLKYNLTSTRSALQRPIKRQYRNFPVDNHKNIIAKAVYLLR
jgi:hypothetical protein